MLQFALDLANERTLERMATVSRNGSPREQLRELVCATLPLDADRRAEATVWFSYAAAATASPATRPSSRRSTPRCSPDDRRHDDEH